MLRIGARCYQKNQSPGVYEVPLGELGELRVGDIPPHSSVEITGLPIPPPEHEFSMFVTNGGDEGDYEYLTIFGFVGFEARDDPARKMSRIRRIYLPIVERGDLPDPLVTPRTSDRPSSNGASFTLGLAGRPETIVREAIRPLLMMFERLSMPEARVFVCHASEDKPVAREFASRLSALGAEVWLDEWEIRIGDSIIEKVNSGLESASHLAVLLSVNSVNKPWVKRELSATLMRQLASACVVILPVRLGNCSIPTILSDIKYADCRQGLDRGVKDVAETLFLPK